MIAVWLRNQVSVHTRTSYEHAWNAWQAHSGGRPLGETTLADLQAFQAALARDRRPGSVNTMLSALRSAFALAHRKGYIRANPCAEINDCPIPTAAAPPPPSAAASSPAPKRRACSRRPARAATSRCT